MQKSIFTIALGLMSVVASAQQTTGVYHYRLLHLETGAGRIITSAHSAGGELDFLGGGALGIDGGTGVVIEAGGGAMRISNPAASGSTLNARLGVGDEILLAAATEVTGDFTLLAAVRKPSTPPVVSGVYRAARLDLTPAVVTEARTTLGLLDTSRTTITLDETGNGTLSDPQFGELNIAVSGDGSYMIGIPRSGNGVFFATRSGNGPGSGLYWLAELAVDRAAPISSIGSLRPGVPGRARLSQRAATVSGPRDYRGASELTVNFDGTGALASTPVGFGVGGSFVGASAAGILFAVEAPTYSGVGPFLNPHGVVNAASLVPFGDPVSPGSLVSLYGSRFLTGDPSATSVQVNGQIVSIVFLSDGQINILLPENLTGESARFVVTVDGAPSNPVTVDLATSGPAVFSADSSGVGTGLLTHSDYSLITSESPARRGEIVIVWAAGLGVSQPAPRVLFGGLAVEVLFAGRHPDFPGLYQLNVRVPAAVATGNSVPVTLLNAEGECDTVETAITF